MLMCASPISRSHYLHTPVCWFPKLSDFKCSEEVLLGELEVEVNGFQNVMRTDI